VKRLTIIINLSILFALAACASRPTPTPTSAVTQAVSSPTAPSLTPIPAVTVAPGEVVKLSGDTFTTSDPIHIDAATTLAISWNYTGSGPFALWLINVGEEVSDPQYDRMLIVDVDGPPSGAAQQPVIAGDYAVQVEQAEGPWTVEVTIVP
jgi:hypothetical protein